VGSDKRERQKLSRQAKIEAEEIAARRARTKRTGIRVAVAAIVVIGAMFAYSAISGGDDDNDSAASDDASTTTLEETTLPPTTTTTFSDPELAAEVMGRDAPDPEPPPADTPKDALEKTTVIEGQGDVTAAAGDTLVVHYIGKTSDDNVFDQSWERGEPFPVVIGTGQVIPGWDEGLIGVKIGEERRLVIGSDKAYGAAGQGDIPANAPLAFVVDVVDIIKAQPAG
jgi:FKBP-type peptidyl-prolyl cis-trans isomerase